MQETWTTADRVPVGGGVVLPALGVVVTQPVEGEFVAFDATCPHRGCLVKSVAAGTIACFCHGSRFRVADGSVAGGPAAEPLRRIPLAVVVLACGEWAMLAGAVSSVMIQAAAVWLVLGTDAFTAFGGNIPTTIAYADLLEAKPFLSHSLRAVTRVMPNWIGLPVWVLLSGVGLWYTVRLWRSQAPVRVRLGAVVLASALVNPHMIIYDLTVLALPFGQTRTTLRLSHPHATQAVVSLPSSLHFIAFGEGGIRTPGTC